MSWNTTGVSVWKLKPDNIKSECGRYTCPHTTSNRLRCLLNTTSNSSRASGGSSSYSCDSVSRVTGELDFPRSATALWRATWVPSTDMYSLAPQAYLTRAQVSCTLTPGIRPYARCQCCARIPRFLKRPRSRSKRQVGLTTSIYALYHARHTRANAREAEQRALCAASALCSTSHLFTALTLHCFH